MKWLLVVVVSLMVIGPAAGLPVLGQTGGGMMMSGMGMMGGPFAPSARPIGVDRAIQILRAWPAAHNVDGLVLDEVETYTQNYYGQFKERATGRGAIQVLVDRYTGRAMPEMGPNMMWNSRYGHAMRQDMMDMMGGTGMGGMMGPSMMGGDGMMGGGSAQGPNAPAKGSHLSEAQARQRANQFLTGYLPGTVTGDADTFYGYYHFEVMRSSRQIGMLSVNDTTGQVWYHTWHGEFLEKREVANP
jgi:hypothetical protein